MSKKNRKRNSIQQNNNLIQQQKKLEVKVNSKTEEKEEQLSLFATSFSGPMPPASELDKYEQIYPGAAKIIIDMAIKEQHQRHSLENKDMNAVISLTKSGQRFGFFLALIGLLMGAILVYFDKDITQYVFLLGALATLILAAIYGRRKLSQMDREKYIKAESDGNNV